MAVAGTLVATGGTANASPTVSYPSSVPSWARAANDAGTDPSDPIVEGEIFLTLKNFQAAQAEALAVSTPGNAQFHKYLSPASWISTYAPSTSDLQSVESYLTGQGFTIEGAPLSREYVVFRGPASEVFGAFGTKLHLYRFAGKKLLAPSSVPTLPASIAAKVEGFSIDQGSTLTRPDNIKSDAKTTKTTATKAPTLAATPLPVATCSSYWGQNTVTLPKAYGSTTFPTNICGYTASQIAGAYGVTKLQTQGITGTGQTIAIVDAYSSPSIVKDSQTVEAQTGTPLLKASQFTDISPPSSTWADEDLCEDPSGWQPEEAIDVQSAHGMAPGANILYSGGYNCGGGLDLALSKILDKGLATIVSNSYGDSGEALPTGTLIGEQSREFQAAAEGIGLYFSSGDNGDEVADIGYKTPDFEASSPWVTAVGGTSLAVSAGNTYLFETGWGSTRDQVVSTSTGLAYAETLPGSAFRGGAGGGVSTNFSQPAYQKGVVPGNMSIASDGSTGRVVPDISSLADPYTGFSIGISPITDDSTLTTGAFELDTYGGTSLASPLIAGQVALAQQATGKALGFINPGLYALDKAAPASFHDVQPFSPPKAVGFTNAAGSLFLTTLDRDTSLATKPGYDEVTGIGTPNVAKLEALAGG